MLLDTYLKTNAIKLLQLIANSLYERGIPTDSLHNISNFTTAEVEVVQEWLLEFMKEINKKETKK